jgi:phosphodiesterase/alkaline phosphatase D-like protein
MVTTTRKPCDRLFVFASFALLWLSGLKFFFVVQAAELFHGELLTARTVEEIRDIIARQKKTSEAPSDVTDAQQQQRDQHQRFLRGSERSDHTVAATYGFTTGGFYHSVASGDPTQDSVIIWTRYTPVSADDVITLEFRLAEINGNGNHTAVNNDPTMITDEELLDPARNLDLRRGLVTVTKATDFVAKIDLTGLPSGTHFAYVFLVHRENGGGAQQGSGATAVVSDIGLTRTAPAPGDPGAETLTYAQFSCAHFLNGFFHPYDIASTIEGLDLAIFVGDYIYECAYEGIAFSSH